MHEKRILVQFGSDDHEHRDRTNRGQLYVSVLFGRRLRYESTRRGCRKTARGARGKSDRGRQKAFAVRFDFQFRRGRGGESRNIQSRACEAGKGAGCLDEEPQFRNRQGSRESPHRSSEGDASSAEEKRGGAPFTASRRREAEAGGGAACKGAKRRIAEENRRAFKGN